MTESRHTATGADEVAAYVAAVRDALADLPPRERDELLEDLTAHLTEVAAEGDLPLWNRVGPPWEYAAELRAAVRPQAQQPSQRWLSRLAAPWRARLGEWDTRLGRLLGYEHVTDFLRLLTPAWWVLRGYLLAVLFVTLLGDGGQQGLLPRLSDSTLLGLVILMACIVGSVWLAKREQNLSLWKRRGVYAGSVVLALFGLGHFALVDSHGRSWDAPAYVYHDYDPLGHVEDVVPVDETGRVLTNIRLLDQNGNQIDLGWWHECEPHEFDEDGAIIIRYPRCPESLSWWDLLPPTASPEPTAPPSASAGPTPAPETASPSPSSSD